MKRLFILMLLTLFALHGMSQSLTKPDLWMQPHSVKDSDIVFLNTITSGMTLHYSKDTDSLREDLINFNPGITFGGDNPYYYIVWDSLNPFEHATIMTAYQNKNVVNNTFGIWEVKGDSLSLFGLDNRYLHIGTFKIQYADTNLRCPVVNTTSQKINRNKSSLFDKDSLFFAKNKDVMFKGNLGEILVFNKQLNQQDRDRWQSYLSIKYGSTIMKGVYVSGIGDTLWNYADDSLYSHGVAGLGYDTLTGLNQKQSAIYDDSITISMNNEYIDNESNPSIIPNGNYLIWGHNGKNAEFAPQEYHKDTLTCHLLQRQWKLRHYYQDISVNIPTILSYKYPSFLNPEKHCLIVNRTGSEEMEFLSSTIHFPDSIAGNKIYFKNVLWTSSGEPELKYTIGYAAAPSDVKAKNMLFAGNEENDLGNQANNTTGQINENNITLYPNPSKGKYTLSVRLLEDSPLSVTITDFQGKILKRSNYTGKKNYEITDKISLKGSYIISVEHNGGTKNLKLVIN